MNGDEMERLSRRDGEICRRAIQSIIQSVLVLCMLGTTFSSLLPTKIHITKELSCMCVHE